MKDFAKIRPVQFNSRFLKIFSNLQKLKIIHLRSRIKLALLWTSTWTEFRLYRVVGSWIWRRSEACSDWSHSCFGWAVTNQSVYLRKSYYRLESRRRSKSYPPALFRKRRDRKRRKISRPCAILRLFPLARLSPRWRGSL